MSGFGGGGSGFEAEAGGGNPTGYSESSGTVTIADELNVGTAADAVATGDFAAGLTGAGRVFWDASAAILYLYNTAGTRRGAFSLTTTGMDVMRADAVQSSWALSTASHTLGPILRSDGYVSWSANTATGSTTGDLRLARGAAATLTVSDPNGVANGTLRTLNSAGTTYAELYHDGTDGFLNLNSAGATLGIRGLSGHLYYDCTSARGHFWRVGGTVELGLVADSLAPASSAGVDLGKSTTPFANAYLAGTTQVASLGIKSNSELLSGLSGASASTTSLVPAGCTILYVVARVTTLITGATTFDVGDGSDVDRYGAAIAVAAGTTVDETDGTADPRSWSASAQDVTLTANGGNFTAGAVRITAFYLDPTAPTS